MINGLSNGYPRLITINMSTGAKYVSGCIVTELLQCMFVHSIKTAVGDGRYSSLFDFLDALPIIAINY